MKRGIFSLCLLGLSVLAAFGGDLVPLVPKNARDMGLGGSFLAVSSGFSSLYGNPAGFAAEKGELTLLDASTWLYVKPTSDNVARFRTLFLGEGSQEEAVAAANDLLVENGLGGGFSFGLGYVGAGFGLGVYAVSDEYASGETALGARLASATSLNAVIGFGLPVYLGSLRIDLGGDARPFYRIDSAGSGWSLIDLIQGASVEDQPAMAGFGLAMDFGASLALGSLTVGFALRDLSPSFFMDDYFIGDILYSFEAGSFPEIGPDADKVLMTPYLGLGLSWKPRIVPGLLEPGLYFELKDPIRAVQDGASFWNLLHAGIDLRLLSFMTARAGLNRGWLSAGFGLDLAVLEIDAAVFTEELGLRPGDLPRTGIAVQAAMRF